MEGLFAEAEADYSLWKATSKFKQPIARIPPLKNETGEWIRRDEEKAELFAKHLARVFQPHDIETKVQPTITLKDNEGFKHVSPIEIARIIDNMKINKVFEHR